MQKKFDQFEEDAILLNYNESFLFSSKSMKDIMLDNIFSMDELKNAAVLYGEDEDYEDMLDSIGKNFDLLRLYVAASFSIITEEGIRRGIPHEVASQMKRTGLLELNKVSNQKELDACNHRFVETFHNKYKELYLGCHSHLVNRAVDVIYFYKRRKISLQKISEILNVNASYLSKIFRRETGKTVSEYILMVKMEQALLLLDREVYTLSEIGDQLGFSSYSYFSQRFKKYFGISPEQYLQRKDIKND